MADNCTPRGLKCKFGVITHAAISATDFQLINLRAGLIFAVVGTGVTEALSQRYMLVLTAALFAAALLVSTGFFSIDEAIYYLGARAIAEGGTLGINNGYDQFHSEGLKLEFLVTGPLGLTPQYPAGSAVLAGVFLPFLGPRAFIAFNALAAILTLFTVRRICIDQFKSDVIAKVAIGLLVLGSFWSEYAIGIWPHSIAVFFSTQAYWFALRHLDSGGSDHQAAFLSGLFAGSGVLFRLDAIFIVPAIGLIVVLFSPRLVRSSIFVGAGVLPPIAVASFFNYLKFGSPNPFSYGSSGGGTDLMNYGPLLAALCVAFGALLVLRKVQPKIDRKRVAVSIVIFGGIALLIPPLAGKLAQFWNGFLALIVNATTIVDLREGVRPGEGGTILFFDMVKKALGQSLPWIGLTGILLTGKIRDEDRRMIITLVIGIASLTIPFILLSWHGGGGSNMRYFLPGLPLLAILCAKLITDLWRSTENPKVVAAAGAWIALGLGSAWSLLAPSGYAGVHQILSTYLLIAMVLAAITAGITWRHQEAGRGLAILLFSCCFLLSVSFAISDFAAAQRRRAGSASVGLALANLPHKSLVVALPEWVADRIPGNGSILATRNRHTKQIDQQLIVKALRSEYRVFLAGFQFEASRDVPPGVEASLSSFRYPEGGQMIELWRKKATAPEAPEAPGP